MDIGQRALSALKWTAAAKFTGQLLTWAITLVVIRLLTPTEYGLAAMAMIFVGLVGLVSGLGLGLSIIQAREIERGQLQRVYGAVILTNLVAVALLFGAAPLIAGFFGEPKLTPMVQVLSLSFLFSAFSGLPSALLRRDLKFRAISMVDLAAMVVGSLVTLFLALRGEGAWALILGTIAKSLLNVVALNLVAPPRFWPKFGFAGMRQLYAFGGMSTLNGILWQLFSQVDSLIVGKLLGKELLGVYSVAMNLATLPLSKVLSVIQPVALPAFARLQDDLPRIADTVRRSIRIMSVVAFPVFWGISCVAPEIVAVVLGEKWRQAQIPLQLLPLVMPLRLVSGVVSPAVNGVGRVDVIVRNTATALAIMTAGFLIGSRWGVIGVSLAWVILFPLVMGFNFRRSLGVLSLSVPDLLKQLTRPLLASAAMYGAVAGIRLLVQGTVPPLAQLLLLVIAGVAVYGLATLAVNRDGLRELMRLFRK